MANGHDNLLDLPPRAPEVSEAVAPRGFDIFLQQHYKGLVQFLRQRTVTEQDAEDAAQESLARLLRYRESEPARARQPLLFRIANNVANDHLRPTPNPTHNANGPLG